MNSNGNYSIENWIKQTNKIGWILIIVITAFFMFAIGYNYSHEEDSKLIQDLKKQIVDDNKLVDMMDKATNDYYNETSSVLDAVRLAEVDNFTMQNQISQHCFWKMTGSNSSLGRCYDTNDTDEKIQACMTGHNFMAFQTHRIAIQESYNKDLCTKEVNSK